MKNNIFKILFSLALVFTFIQNLPEVKAGYHDTPEFITTWNVEGPSSPTIYIYTDAAFAGQYDFDIDWGDGSPIETNQTSTISHLFPANDTDYTVKITGDFPHFLLSDPLSYGCTDVFNNPDHLKEIKQWGSIAWESMTSSFACATDLNITATDAPELGLVNDMNYMFKNATGFYSNSSINSWDTSNVTSMHQTFYKASTFNQSINNWDVSSVSDMSLMFREASAFNQPLNNWDVSAVSDMSSMFREASAFNQPLNNWDVSSVTSMEQMFYKASDFNQPLNNWDVSSVTNMATMFNEASDFNQSINNWDVSSVTNMSTMFAGASSFNQPLNDWDVSSVTNMSIMFAGATAFNRPLNSWTTNSVTNMYAMFYLATSFDQSLSQWNIEQVSNMLLMFANAGISTSNYDQTLSAWSTQNLKSNVNFNGGSSKYCNSQADRQSIIDNFNWTILDGGKDCTGIDNGKDVNAEQEITCNDILGGVTLTVPSNLIFEGRTTNFHNETDAEIDDPNDASIIVKDDRGYDPDSHACGNGFTLSIQSDGLRLLDIGDTDYNLELGLGDFDENKVSEDKNILTSSPATLIGNLVTVETIQALSREKITSSVDLLSSSDAFFGDLEIDLINVLKVFKDGIQKASPHSNTPVFSGNINEPIPPGNYIGTITVTVVIN